MKGYQKKYSCDTSLRVSWMSGNLALFFSLVFVKFSVNEILHSQAPQEPNPHVGQRPTVKRQLSFKSQSLLVCRNLNYIWGYSLNERLGG